MWRHRKQLKIYLENSNLRVRRNEKKRNQSFFYFGVYQYREKMITLGQGV